MAVIDGPLESAHYGAWYALRRATELHDSCRAYFAAEPLQIVAELDQQTGEMLHKIKLREPMPLEWAGMIFDIVNNLRSALDQAGYAIAIATGASGKDAHFPFGDSLAEVQSRRKSGARDIPASVFECMVAAAPYKDGNHDLWALNRFCNTHKHEVILAPQVTLAGGRGRIMMSARRDFTPNLDGKATVTSFAVNQSPKWNPAKGEMTLLRCAPDAKPDIRIQAPQDVMIEKVGAVEPLRVLEFFNSVGPGVERILVNVEVVARQAGILK